MPPLFGRPRSSAAPEAASTPRPAPSPAPGPSPRPRAAEGARLGDRYELGRLLGEGGEASVFAARDVVLGRDVAVKLFRRQVAPPSEGVLQQMEARVGAALNHYALTTLLDTGVAPGPDGAPQLYLVMEYVPGESLSARLQRGPMQASEACWLTFDLAEGLDHMHQTGYVHRDVKPGNVLISGLRSARPVVAKLTDFGIAAPVGEPDLSEFTVGTAAYLSPEQVEGLDAGPESDVYSLGLVMLEAMTGRVAFPGSVTQAAFDRLTRDPAIPESVPPRTAALIRRMTAREPGARIALHEAAVELQQILVDDLLERRGDAVPPPGAPAPGGDLQAVVEQARLASATAVRLLAAAVDAPLTALVLRDEDGRDAVVAAAGWAQRPVELEAQPFAPARSTAEAWSVADVLDDPVLSRHPAAGAPHRVRAAAGAPVRQPGGGPVGALLALDVRAREFTPAHLQALQDAAALIEQDLGLRLAVRRALFPA